MRGGVTAMEAAIAFICILGGLLVMAPYFQRAMQGNVFGSAQAMGQPFDPRDSFSETQQITVMEDTVTQQPVWGMFGADLQRTRPISDEMLSLYAASSNPRLAEHPGWILESLPSGPVFREPAVQLSESNASWNVTRTATYNDAR